MVRQLKALAFSGLLWAVAWALIGIVVGLVDWGFFATGEFSALAWLPNAVVGYVILFGACGGLCGIGFGLLLASAERNRTIADLSVRRMALWGALAGAIMPLAGLLGVHLTIDLADGSWTWVAIVAGASAAMGGGAAAGSLSAARKVRLPANSIDPRSEAT